MVLVVHSVCDCADVQCRLVPWRMSRTLDLRARGLRKAGHTSIEGLYVEQHRMSIHQQSRIDFGMSGQSIDTRFIGSIERPICSIDSSLASLKMLVMIRCIREALVYLLRRNTTEGWIDNIRDLFQAVSSRNRRCSIR